MNSIYTYTLNYENEQAAPKIVLISDPSVPDRTNALLWEKEEKKSIISCLQSGVESLLNYGVSAVVVPCITSHYFLTFLPNSQKTKIIDLISIINSFLNICEGKQFLLATKGTYNSKMIGGKGLVYPNTHEQELIHSFIYCLKKQGNNVELFNRFIYQIFEMKDRYNLDGVLLACTELHLLSKYLLNHEKQLPFFDPLL